MLELIRQLLDQEAWYTNTDDPTLTTVEDVIVCATMSVVSSDSSRSPIPSRLMRHLAVLHVCPLSDADMRTVFGHTLHWYHEQSEFPHEVIELEGKIVNASLAVYERVRARLKPIPGYPQYIFSLRDLRRVLEGMCLQTAEDLADSVDSAENEHTRLWCHEVLRVFYDRVQDADDRLKICDLSLWQNLFLS